ncbi:hypothetical protein [Heyndrickxia acidicola]|uniref:Uncharacterized protein n=1 Tax=Heyndrickxia acidicola TaxID=209389 RepID=A0ABU6MJM2_9BACI|nr:hypothetical protein [Heyndrickxia acidicola]MED1204669.1 hypothetical protein [Heyndrickxia acidicola]
MTRLKYSVAADKIDLQENRRDEDIEFEIRVKNSEIIKDLRELRHFFESDEIFTDILFYTFKDHIQIIVKKEAYITLLLGLFKWKLLDKVEWVDEKNEGGTM